ncbi:MAG TPA: hypothetical protein VKP67_01645 [Xanthobacteraceae bacterium]|nr:hypothetical protein [Xanthobacteraceae bacterium]
MSATPVGRSKPAGRLFGLIALAGSFLCACVTAWPSAIVAQQGVTVPDFTIDSKSAWLMVGDDLLPPPSGPGPISFDKRYPYVDNGAARRTGTQPTYRVADLSNPILLPWAREQMRKANEWVLAGKVPFRARERCYPAGVPGWVIYTLAEPIFVLQTAKQVTMINQGGPEVRRIYLNVPHSQNPKPSWYGESVGHYEGNDTLVVDTIAISTKTFVDSYLTPHTDQLHVVERYKLQNDGKAMEVLITVDDPGAFTTPWSAIQRFRRVPRQWTEDICAENNIDFLHYEVMPLPQADKPDF